MERRMNSSKAARAAYNYVVASLDYDRLVDGTKVGNGYRTQGGDKKLLGGDGNDMIIGGRRVDIIVGWEGNDLLAHSDTLTEPSNDKIFGGDGTDGTNAISKPAAKAMSFCGNGTDVVLVDREDEVAADCEKVFVGLGATDAWFEAFPEGFLAELWPFVRERSRVRSSPQSAKRGYLKMRTLPATMIQVLAPFAPLFSKRVFQHVQLLVAGTMLAPGKRTVASALRAVGLQQERCFCRYHRVLSRAAWSSREASRILLELLVEAFAPDGALVLGVDETLERRSGKKIAAKGIYRDPARSTHEHFVKTSAFR